VSRHKPTLTSWHRVFHCSVEEISSAASWIESIAFDLHLRASQMFAMQVCLEELMSNIVRHAQLLPSLESGLERKQQINLISIAIEVSALADRMVMTVEDNGPPFNVVEAPAKGIDRPLDEVQPGGLGIHLIRNFADSLDYHRVGDTNRVVTEFLSSESSGSQPSGSSLGSE
jgi:anti-sigma regulatory factor (Ser/Thr protein kinase)